MTEQLGMFPSDEDHDASLQFAGLIVDGYMLKGQMHVVLKCEVEHLLQPAPWCFKCLSHHCCREQFRVVARAGDKVCGNLSGSHCKVWPDAPVRCLLHPFTVTKAGVLRHVHHTKLMNTCDLASLVNVSKAYLVHEAGITAALGEDFFFRLKTTLAHNTKAEKVGVLVKREAFARVYDHDFRVHDNGLWQGEGL